MNDPAYARAAAIPAHTEITRLWTRTQASIDAYHQQPTASPAVCEKCARRSARWLCRKCLRAHLRALRGEGAA